MPDSNRKPHLFGTDGIRGEYGKTLNKFIAYRVGRYIGYSPINHRYKIAIGRDTRYSGKYLFESLKNGILNRTVKVNFTVLGFYGLIYIV